MKGFATSRHANGAGLRATGIGGSALMPDAPVGYSLPIGGVIATHNAVIPYAVGVGIACRVKMTALDLPVAELTHKPDRLSRVLGRETRFGVGALFRERRQHKVMAEQRNLATVLGEFMPKMVKMAPSGERPED